MSEIENQEKLHMLEELRLKEKKIEENLEMVSKYQHYGPCLKCNGWGKNLCNPMAYCKRCFNILRKVNPNFLDELDAHIKENQ